MRSQDEILRSIQRYRHVGKLSADQRNEIGKALDEIQSLLPRGQFGPWIAQNMWFSYGMASYYLKCYRDNAVVSRYEDAARAYPDGPGAFNESTSQTMNVEDYKKLAMSMRDNIQLTAEKQALQRRIDQLAADARAHSTRLMAKDEEIRRLQRELREEQMGGNPFGNIFGGMASGLTKAEYRTLISVLHPDRAMNEEQRAAFTKASQIVNGKMKAH